jgi:two-component system LytT family response regulator
VPTRRSIRTLIVDDEPLARAGLRRLCGKHHDVEVVGEAANAGAAAQLIVALDPDLVFLDVRMPQASGFDLIRSIGRARLPPFVFVTAFESHAVDAFDVDALDYLLKPISTRRFDETMQRVRVARTPNSGTATAAAGTNVTLATPPYKQRLLLRSIGQVRLVLVNDIDWIAAAGNYVRLHCGQTSQLLRHTLSGLEAQLDPAQFLRIHRSTIVRIDRIVDLRPRFAGDYQVTLRGGATVVMSYNYRHKVGELGG